MQRMNAGKTQISKKMTNKGFSLVEVLVCVALIALICVPLFSGLRMSATLNSKAHHTQKVTAYAQEELEYIKSVSVESYISPYGTAGPNVVDGVSYTYINSGAEWQALSDRAQDIRNNFSSSVTLTAEQEKELFSPFICEKKDVEIGGKKYTMHVSFMPAEYSQYDKSTAANVNVSGFYEIAEADAVKFPVISSEINLYDSGSVALLKSKLKEVSVDKSEADIMANMKKTVCVTIESPISGTTDKMSVRCDVTYSYPKTSPLAELSYCVYRGTYDVSPADGTQKGTESGGNAFIFARAFRSSSNLCENNLIIDSTGDTNVYFILGSTDTAERYYNFNNITVNGLPYLENYIIKAGLVPGELSIAGTNGMFYCNVKENGENFDLDPDKKQETIGHEKYKAIGYAVEIDMYDQADGNKQVAHLEATKIDR